jgi:hypothetical protein
MADLFDGFEGHRVLADADTDKALTSALVAIDANVLLNLYRYNVQTTDDLLAVFARLGDRLVVPHQAIREFHRNRLAAVGNPEGASQDVRAALQKNQRSTLDAVGRWGKQIALDDATLTELSDEVDGVFGRLLHAVDERGPARVRPNTPAAEDRVLARLTPLLEGKVLPRPSDEDWAMLVAEGRERVAAHRPPGYLDADKGDQQPEGPAGDFIVYRQASDEAIRRHLDLVIVTGDEKDDWWWRHRSVVIGPRSEMVKEFFDVSGGHRLFLLRPQDLLLRSAALDVTVSPTSLEDAGRERGEIEAVGRWTAEGVTELLHRLDVEGLPQAEIIREAAALGGTIMREAVYAICGYDDDRMLRGFTRPTARLTTDLQREGLVGDSVVPALVPLYPDDARAAGFRIPPEMVTICAPGRYGKYQPLTDWLDGQTQDEVPVTFAEIEEIIGQALAPSARKYPPYWYSAQNSLGKALAAAGFKASQVSLTAETAMLVRR